MSPTARRAGAAAGAALLVATLFILGFAVGRAVPRDTSASHAPPDVGLRPLVVTAPPTAAASRRVALVGDSLLAGGSLDDALTPPADLRRILPGVEVVNLTVGAETPGDAVLRVRALQLLRPDAVVFWLGSQDALVKEDPAVFLRDYTVLLDRVAAPRVVLITPLPTRDAPAGSAQPYIDAVRRLGARPGATLVDLTGLISRTDYGADGEHLTADACAAVAGRVAPSLAGP